MKTSKSWTKDRMQAISQMWMWGIGSTEIAKMLDLPGRNMVMGKLNRMGLMGSKGFYLSRRNDNITIEDGHVIPFIESITNDRFSWDDPVDRHIYIIICALEVGQDSETIANASGRMLEDVENTLASLHEHDIWKTGQSPCSQWWHHKEGNMSLLLDAMVSCGIIAKEYLNGEAHYCTI